MGSLCALASEDSKKAGLNEQGNSPQSWNQQMYVCQVFDQLIYNTDRNQGNLVITSGWQVWMIDRTRAFRMRKDLENPKNLVQYHRKLLTKSKQDGRSIVLAAPGL